MQAAVGPKVLLRNDCLTFSAIRFASVQASFACSVHIAKRPLTRRRITSALTPPTIKHARKGTAPAHSTSDRFACRTAPPMACPHRHKERLQDCQGCRTAKREAGASGPNVTVFDYRNAGHIAQLQRNKRSVWGKRDRLQHSQTVQKTSACPRCQLQVRLPLFGKFRHFIIRMLNLKDTTELRFLYP